MTRTFPERIEALEQAVLHFEGAHYALHDIIALSFSTGPEADVRAVLQTLADRVSVHADKIGEIRFAGYTRELSSIAEEIAHARPDAPSLLPRLAGRWVGARTKIWRERQLILLPRSLRPRTRKHYPTSPTPCAGQTIQARLV